MASRTYRLPSAHDQPSLRRRATGFGLAIAINLLLLFLLRGVGALEGLGRPSPSGAPLVVTLSPDQSPAPAAAPVAQPRPRPRPPTPDHPIPPTMPPVPVPVVKLPTPPSAKPLALIPMTKTELAAADIANIHSTAGASSGAQAGDSKPIGTAPNGEAMYRAEWFREPTSAEVGGYLPAHMPAGGGWGLIACKTIANHHVDDCVELDQSPHGSHLAGAVRQAAWQFLVRPPRVNGKELVGSWVSIQITYENGGGDGSKDE